LTFESRLRVTTTTRARADSAPALDRGLSAAALQELASVALTEAANESGRGRRGPFRPEVWLSARQRHASRLAAHYFRAFDILVVVAITIAAVWSVSPAGLATATVAEAAPFVVASIVLLALLPSLGLYRFARDESPIIHLGAIAGATVSCGIGATALGLLLNGAGAPFHAYMVWSGLCVVGLYGLHIRWSSLVARWRARGDLTPNIVVVGATKNAERLIREALGRRDINILGVFDDRLARSPDSVQGVPVLGDTDALMTHKMLPYVDRIVLAVDPAARVRVRELSQRLAVLPNEVSLLVDPQGSGERIAALEKLAQAPLAPLDRSDPDRRAFNKRLQDLILGGVGLVVLSPVMALTALAIRLDSPGPVMFRQRRHGFNQEEIVVWKFRSMRHDAADATASRQVTPDDDRVTRVGRFLRSTSLDELPQLLNVLSGEMSLVGPRPHAIGMKTGHVESARLVAEYAHRHRIKPGMTGWAAVRGSRGPLHTAQEVRRRVQLDIDYVERQSFWLDLWIILITVPVLLGDRAAIR
jgi:Undecaprenyl-phosphate glucose phosphotransferase